MKRLVIATVSLVLALALTAHARSGSRATHGRSSPARLAWPAESGQPVIDWNQELLSIVNTPGAQPANIQPTWSFAILHAAIYDAVNSIDRSHEPYVISVRAPRDASETAAADAAAHPALVGLYPAQQGALDAEYAAELAQVPDGAGEGRRRPRRRAGRPRPARDPHRRRLERRAAALRSRRESGQLPADAPELPGARLQHLGERHAVRARQRRPVPARTAARTDERRSTPRRSMRCRASALPRARPALPSRR